MGSCLRVRRGVFRLGRKIADGYVNMSVGNVLPYAVTSIQELTEIIDDQQTRIDEQQPESEELKTLMQSILTGP